MLGLQEISEAEFDKVMASMRELISRNKELKAENSKMKQVDHSGGLPLKLSNFMTNLLSRTTTLVHAKVLRLLFSLAGAEQALWPHHCPGKEMQDSSAALCRHH